MTRTVAGGAMRMPGESNEDLAERVAAMIAEQVAEASSDGDDDLIPDEDGYYFSQRS